MTAQVNQTLTTATGAQLPIESNMLSPALTQPTALDTSDQSGGPDGYGSGLGHELTTAYEMTSAHAYNVPLTGDTMAGSATITNVVDNSVAGTPYAVGFAVDGPGIPVGAIITSLGAGSITLSQAATADGTGVSFQSWNEWTSAIDPNTIAAGGSGYTSGETVVALGGVTAAAGAPLLGTVTVTGGVVTGFVASDARLTMGLASRVTLPIRTTGTAFFPPCRAPSPAAPEPAALLKTNLTMNDVFYPSGTPSTPTTALPSPRS